MIKIFKEHIKSLTVEKDSGKLIIEYCNSTDKTAVSKIVLKVEVEEVKQAESFNYL